VAVMRRMGGEAEEEDDDDDGQSECGAQELLSS